MIKRQLRSEHQSEGVVILGKYCDALYLSVRGRMRDELAEVLREMKEVLRADGDGEETLSVPGLPGGPLRLQGGSRRKYEFVLRSTILYLVHLQATFSGRDRCSWCGQSKAEHTRSANS